MDMFWVIGAMGAGLLMGGAIAFVIYRSAQGRRISAELYDSAQKQIADLKVEKKDLSNLLSVSQTENAQLKQRIEHLDERLIEERSSLEKMQEQMKKDFELLANEILEKKSEKFTAKNSENLKQILEPLKTQIKDFDERIQRSYEGNMKARSELKGELQQLVELNNQIRKDAVNLTKALKGDSKTRGDWGEMQLERILEQTGLEKDVHYQTQGSYKDENGKRLIPDFIIHLPKEKNLIIDSKVSLVHYERYVNEEDEAQKAVHLKNHVDSIFQHVQDLSKKGYDRIYDIPSPDFVIMFIPIESAFHLAQSADSSKKLFHTALEKNIVMVTTGTLIATLKTVSFIWDQEKQRENIEKIVDRGVKIYDKLVGFVDTFSDIEKYIAKSQEAFDKAKGQLTTGRGNLISQAHKMKQMGVNTPKSLPDNYIRESGVDDE
jgi:DNA recombination protein RmuC